jgi:ATP-dependent Clp protease protease subunit
MAENATPKGKPKRGKKNLRNYNLDHKLKLRQDDPLYYILENDIDLISNHIYLFGIESYIYGAGSEATAEPGVEFAMANRFIRNLNMCMRRNPETPLVIHMKTCGGDYTEGMAIYDAIKAFPWPVTILNYSHARSMSSLIFQAGNKRVMMPNSYFLFHDGTLGVEGTVKQVRSQVKFDKLSEKVMLDIYAKAMQLGGKGMYAQKSQQWIKKFLRNRMDKEEDVFLTADEAIKYGLADEIFDSNWAGLTEYTEEQLAR